MSNDAKIEITLEDGKTLVWYPEEEVDEGVKLIESFFGPADKWED